MRLRSIVLPLLALAVLAGVYLGRRGLGTPLVEREADVVPPPEPTTHPLAPAARRDAPAPAHVREAIDRVFARTLIVDESVRPSTVTGDFNGDGEPDVAAAVLPRDQAALSSLNAQLPPWRIQDAAAPEATHARAIHHTVTAAERLLAVVPGVLNGGWRSPDAHQGWVVKNAVGSAMRSQPLDEAPDALRMSLTRPHVGDVIAVERGGEAGLIVWTGAAYVWADSNTGATAP